MNLNDFIAAGQLSFMGNISDGIRLQKLEVFNWGTFDGKIWSFTPNGDTALLTGDSGSGKSTLVDALLTLLVSPRKIAYNKAADASARERSITSYVRGYYGQKYAYEGRGTPEALRDSNTYTVLLATFVDQAIGKRVSLAMFFWFREQNGNPQKFYVVAQRELMIAEDFAGFHGEIRQLKAALKNGGCEVFDDYTHYADCYFKLLGNLSQQAIDLFQQTISMKKVEALTDFVRSNMLEETAIMDDIEKLLQHYHSLNNAYEAVQRARKQAELLEPICARGRRHSQLLEEAGQLVSGRKALDCWFASLKADLYVERIAQLEGQSKEAAMEAQNEQALLDTLEEEIRRLDGEISQNGGNALENQRAELRRKEEALERCQKAFNSYAEHARLLNLASPDTRAIFIGNQRDAKELERQLPRRKEEAGNQFSDISGKLDLAKKTKADIDEEILSLQGRTSNIPKELIKLRQQMCAALSLDEAQLPFAGELIEVMDREIEWEGAIERLLHNFALSVLVSEDHYAAVSQWVNTQHLGARLVYFATKPRPGSLPELPDAAVANKLAVKEQTPFTQWLKRELAERFDHVCCRDMAAFRREKRAITLTGQLKATVRHEKDDRRAINDRTRYVLGFSNQKKIKVLAGQAAELGAKIPGLTGEKDLALAKINELGRQEVTLATLAGFTDFAEIDVKSARQECNACELRIEELNKRESSVLSVLRRQRDAAVAKKGKQNDKLVDVRARVQNLAKDLSQTQEKQRQNSATQQSESPLERLSYGFLESNRVNWLGDAPLTLENADGQKTRYLNRLNSRHEKLQDESGGLKAEIVRGITQFQQEFPLEMREADDTIDSLPELYRMQSQLIKDDLPKYERDFKELLTTQVLQRIALFQMTLKQQYDRVKDRIAAINTSMYDIDYNPSRFIKLNCEDNPDAEIKAFRAALKACTEGATNDFNDEGAATARFLQIKEIIQRFQGREKESEADKKWTKKVTDVRNWFVFSASERWRETDEEYEHYTDSGGKSGGQKEKLAYTILAASLVYNYGLHEEYNNNSSFRLVVIDEAFLKSSDESAKFGLQLFAQLKFQLVIVTPLLKISTIEPFITQVGFVSHDDVTHESSLMNISIEVYKEKRRAWEELHHG